MARLATIFVGHPLRLGALAVALIAAAAVAWYLGSPLFIRTYTNEALPPAAQATATAPAPQASAPASQAPVGPRVLSMGDLQYVDAIHNGKGTVRIVDLGGQRVVRFEEVAI